MIDLNKEFRVNLNTLSRVGADVYARIMEIPNAELTYSNGDIEIYTIGMANDVIGFKFGRQTFVRLRELPMIFRV